MTVIDTLSYRAGKFDTPIRNRARYNNPKKSNIVAYFPCDQRKDIPRLTQREFVYLKIMIDTIINQNTVIEMIVITSNPQKVGRDQNDMILIQPIMVMIADLNDFY